MSLHGPSTPFLRGVVDLPVLMAPALIAPPHLPLCCWTLDLAFQWQKGLRTSSPNLWFAVEGGEAQWGKVLRLQHELSNPALAVFSCLWFSDPSIQLVLTCMALDSWAKAQKLGYLKGCSGAHLETTMMNRSYSMPISVCCDSLCCRAPSRYLVLAE